MAPASHVARKDTLVAGRMKRSTAGNRMRALLDSELEQETGFEEIEDDVDFVGKDEEDAFESDFASTDEDEGDHQDEDAEEREVRREEKHQRKLSRANPTRDPSMNYLKPRAQPRAMPSSLDPSAPSNAAPRRPPKQSHIAFADGDKIPEGGQDPGDVVPEGDDPDAGASGQAGRAGETAEETRRRRRASGRTATIAFKSEVDARLAAEAEERLKMPSRYKPPPPKARYTQDELIEEALYTEEMNNESLQDWLEKEEARRLALRVVRKKIEGPVVTWISRDSDRKPIIEEVVEETVEAEEETEPKQDGKGKGKEAASATTSPTKPHKNATASSSRTKGSTLVASPDPETEERHARNLVLLDPAPTSWSSEMRVLFGTHVNWSTMRVVPARNRPQTRRPPLCPITGLQASYLDPRTGIPYANISAYSTLTALLAGSYAYAAELGCYVGGGDVKPADGIDEVEWRGEKKDEREREEARVRARVRRAEEKEERERVKELGEMAPVEGEEEEEAQADEEMEGVEDEVVEVMEEVEEEVPIETGRKRKRPSLGGQVASSASLLGIKRKKT